MDYILAMPEKINHSSLAISCAVYFKEHSSELIQVFITSTEKLDVGKQNWPITLRSK